MIDNNSIDLFMRLIQQERIDANNEVSRKIHYRDKNKDQTPKFITTYYEQRNERLKLKNHNFIREIIVIGGQNIQYDINMN